MSLFTDWKDCDQIISAIIAFLENTAQHPSGQTLWYESTKELIESSGAEFDTLGVWTTSDILFAFANTPAQYSRAHELARKAADTLCDIAAERATAYDNRRRPELGASTLDELAETMTAKTLKDEGLEARLVLQERWRHALQHIGMPRNLARSAGTVHDYHGPSQTLSTASTLRALLKVHESKLSESNKIGKTVALLTQQLGSLCPAKLMPDLVPSRLWRESNAAKTLKDQYEPFITPPKKPLSEKGPHAWELRAGFMHEVGPKEYAWSIDPWKNSQPDPFTTVSVLEALAEAANTADLVDDSLRSRLRQIVNLSLQNYLLPTIILFLGKSGTSAPPPETPETQKAVQRFSQGLNAEHLRYNDLARLLITLCSLLDRADTTLDSTCADEVRCITHLLTTKIVEKLFIDLAIL